MKPAAFIEYLRKAFGQKADLPIAVWYSDEPLSATEKAGGCIFKHLDAIGRGATVSLDGDNTGCGGGKFYCGFSDMPPHVPAFVSEKEHYKASPELVLDIIRRTDVRRSPRRYLNLARIDMLDSFKSIAGIGMRPVRFGLRQYGNATRQREQPRRLPLLSGDVRPVGKDTYRGRPSVAGHTHVAAWHDVEDYAAVLPLRHACVEQDTRPPRPLAILHRPEHMLSRPHKTTRRRRLLPFVGGAGARSLTPSDYLLMVCSSLHLACRDAGIARRCDIDIVGTPPEYDIAAAAGIYDQLTACYIQR